METTTTVPETRKSISAEPNPNPLDIKVGETVIIDASIDRPIKVLVTSVGNGGYSANVKEVESGKSWSLSMNCLSR